MNALTQPIIAGQNLAKSQHDLHNARSVLDATLRFVRQQAQATDDPFVISRFGDLHIRIEVADCLLYTSPSPRDRTRSRMPSSA